MQGGDGKVTYENWGPVKEFYVLAICAEKRKWIIANNIRWCQVGGNKAFWSKNTQKDIRVRLEVDLWIKAHYMEAQQDKDLRI